MPPVFRTLSKKLKNAKAYEEHLERLKIRKEEIEKITPEKFPSELITPEAPPILPELPKLPSLPSQRQAQAPPIPSVPEMQIPSMPQAPEKEVIRERIIEKGEGVEEISPEEFKMKYKPLSLLLPEKLTAAEGEEHAEELLKRLKAVNIVTPLITLSYQGKSITVAWSQIKWSDRENRLTYNVFEPKLTSDEFKVIDEVRDLLREKLDIDFTKIKQKEAYGFLIKKLGEVLNEIGFSPSPKQRLKIQYYIYRDFIGLGKVEPLMHDPNIEDISCDGVSIPIFVYHRNPMYGQIQTNLMFRSKKELDDYVLRLAQKCNRAISIAEPLLDGALPDGSRVQITYGTDIAMRGSNFTIRKFTQKPITPVDQMNFRTATAEVLSFLWLGIENGLSVLVSGATATGKTSFLNSLSLFIRPEIKIISIEDTPELRLPHPNWIPEVARVGFGERGYGEVTMFDLLKSALRQRPEYIIVGEVRGKEAYVMFQGIATGHPALGTLHASSLGAVIDRLTTEPINLPKAMLENIDIIVFLTLSRKKGEYVRRVKNIVEIVGYDFATKALITNTAFEWDPSKDQFKMMKSIILDKIREKMGLGIESLRRDIIRRIELLKWMQANNITDYRDCARYFNIYYTNPAFVEKILKGGGLA